MARVLVVDDDAAIARMVGLVVKLAGHEPVVITDPRAALRELPRVQAVISDYMMPDMTGVEVLVQAMLVDKTIRRILLTAAPDNPVVQDAVRAGVVQVLVPKPPNIDDITKNLLGV